MSHPDTVVVLNNDDCLFKGKRMNEGTDGLIELNPRRRQLLANNLQSEPNIYLRDSQVRRLGEDGTIFCGILDLHCVDGSASDGPRCDDPYSDCTWINGPW